MIWVYVFICFTTVQWTIQGDCPYRPACSGGHWYSKNISRRRCSLLATTYSQLTLETKDLPKIGQVLWYLPRNAECMLFPLNHLFVIIRVTVNWPDWSGGPSNYCKFFRVNCQKKCEIKFLIPYLRIFEFGAMTQQECKDILHWGHRFDLSDIKALLNPITGYS